jgi:hypothetical protein
MFAAIQVIHALPGFGQGYFKMWAGVMVHHVNLPCKRVDTFRWGIYPVPSGAGVLAFGELADTAGFVMLPGELRFFHHFSII